MKVKNNKVKYLLMLIVVVLLVCTTAVTAFGASLTFIGSGSSGATREGVNASGTGFTVQSTSKFYGYRFSYVDSTGATYGMIDVIGDSYWSEYKESTRYKIKPSERLTKKEIKELVSSGVSLTVVGGTPTSKTYSESSMSFDTGLTYDMSNLATNMKIWQSNVKNINKVLGKISSSYTVAKMKNGEMVLIEPIVHFNFKSKDYAMTLNEIWLWTGSVFGYDTAPASGPSGTYGYIADRINQSFPNKLYTTDGKGLWKAASSLSSNAKFSTLINYGYGVAICYNDAQKTTVTFNKNDGSGSTASQSFNCSNSGKNYFGKNTDGTYKWGNTGQFGKWDRTGYTLKGWSVKSSKSEKINNVSGLYSVYSGVSNSWIKATAPSINLYAIWETNKLKMNFNTNGGTINDGTWKVNSSGAILRTSDSTKYEQTVSYNNYVSSTNGLPNFNNNVKKDGYVFIGWSTDKNANNSNTNINLTKSIGKVKGDNNVYIFHRDYTGVKASDIYANITNESKTITLYAIWKPSTYTVSYDANGGSGAPSNQTKVYGVDLTLSSNVPTRVGYSFNGWNTKSGGTGTKYSSGGKYTANANVVLYAQWKPISYTIVFNGNGNSSGSTPSLSVSYDEEKTLTPNGFVKSGCTFKGWSSNADGTGTRYFDKQNIKNLTEKNNAVITLYARWENANILSLEAITPNADYREGTDVITSFNIINESSNDYIPTNNLTVRFNVYKDNQVIKTVTKEKVVVPGNNKNLLYFKWRVPTDLGDSKISVSGEVVVNGISKYYIKEEYSTCKYEVSKTPDTRYEIIAPSDFEKPSVLIESTGSKTWKIWSYENGEFKRTTYGVTFSSDKPSIMPTASANSSLSGGMWTMKSGYGIEYSMVNGVSTPSGCTTAPENSYTLPQYTTAKLPEFSYRDTVNKYRTLELVSGKWVFRQNETYGRIHFTPLWYPDGNYTICTVQSDLWTPVGMITRRVNSNSITISGSAYDDWYIGG